VRTNRPFQKSIIPVLTEIVTEVPYDAHPQEDTLPASEKDAGQQLSILPPILSAVKNEAAWNELEERLTARILQQVQDRTQLILENSLQIGMKTILRQVAQNLVTEIKKDLERTLEVVVAHAVTEEMLRLQKLEHGLKDDAGKESSGK